MQNSLVLFGLQYNSASSRACRIVRTFWAYSSILSDQIMILSKYTWQIFSINCCSAADTHHWCIARAFLIPIGMTSHSYRPHGMLTAVDSTSSGCIQVWKKLFVISSVAHIFPFAQSARMLSMHGIGKRFMTVFAFSCL